MPILQARQRIMLACPFELAQVPVAGDARTDERGDRLEDPPEIESAADFAILQGQKSCKLAVVVEGRRHQAFDVALL